MFTKFFFPEYRVHWAVHEPPLQFPDAKFAAAILLVVEFVFLQ